MIEHRQAADDFGRQVENHVGAVASFRSACTPAIVVGQAKCSARGEGLVAWIGLLVVVQNIFTSLFNSHLFDFNEGWIYVLGAGVAGGMALKAGASGLDRFR